MRVLIIEDDPALQRFLAKGFARDGNTAVCTSDGDMALRQPPETFDLAVLDLGLPRRDGLEVLRAFRVRDQVVPILVLTGRDSLEERLASFSMGADDFLKKPFSFQELLARCRALYRRASANSTAVLASADLRLDRIARSTTLAGKGVDLTGKEFALLEYLMLQRGRCVSRRELLDEVWKLSPDAGPNVVDVYINYIRRKLQSTGEAHASNRIETVRGQGYRVSFVAPGGYKLTESAPAAELCEPAALRLDRDQISHEAAA